MRVATLFKTEEPFQAPSDSVEEAIISRVLKSGHLLDGNYAIPMVELFAELESKVTMSRLFRALGRICTTLQGSGHEYFELKWTRLPSENFSRLWLVHRAVKGRKKR